MDRRKRRKLVPLHILVLVEGLFEMEVEPVRPDEKYHDKTLPMGSVHGTVTGVGGTGSGRLPVLQPKNFKTLK